MAQSREHKAQSRERILAHASERLRAEGVANLSIAQLMTAVGLTHGGFYRHFESRDDLIAQATQRALHEGAAAGARARAGQPPTLAAYVKGYLSRAHRDAPGNGCAIAALAADVPHAGAATSEAFTAGLKTTLARLATQFDAARACGDTPDAAGAQGGAKHGVSPASPARDKAASASSEAQAVALMSTLVGALVLSRAVDDPALSDLILATNRARLLGELQQAEGGTPPV